MNIKYRPEEAEEILKYYSEGHTQADTMERFNITKNQLQYLAKRHKITNGRTASEIARENGRNGCKSVKAKAEQRLVDLLNTHGFELVSEYKGDRNSVKIRCLKCGAAKTSAPHHIKLNGTTCQECERIERMRTLEKAREEKQKAIKIKREINQNTKEEAHLKRLTAPHVCKICGRIYTIADYMKSTGTRYERNSGYCSASCRHKATKMRDRAKRKKYKAEGKVHSDNHFTRAKKLGLPAERGITLKRLIDRDGLTCALCQLPCFYGGDFRSDLYPSIDHITPIHKGGGHTWDNVQITHRICNSNKRDLIGKEWKNDSKEGAEQP